MLDGAEGITWSDANLTETGQNQAKEVYELWKLLLPKGIPPPETYYVSPLTRTIETADLSFKGLGLPKDKPYRPVVKEVCGLLTGRKENSVLIDTATTRSNRSPHLRSAKHRVPHSQELPTHTPRTALF